MLQNTAAISGRDTYRIAGPLILSAAYRFADDVRALDGDGSEPKDSKKADTFWIEEQMFDISDMADDGVRELREYAARGSRTMGNVVEFLMI
jgi:hypothetical protein